MLNSSIIIKKVNLIIYYLKRITSHSNISLVEFLENEDSKDIVMHNLFMVLQNIIDIGTHIISDEGMEEPDYMSDIPDILAKENVIENELVKPLKSMIGLRNIIAHEYGDIDFNIIYKIIKENISDINNFIDNIIKYYKLWILETEILLSNSISTDIKLC